MSGQIDWLVVGLGNPGAKYQGTPHNVGADVANALAARWELPKAKQRYRGLITQGTALIGGPPKIGVAVLLPQTYMNESGKSVSPARGELRVEPDRILVCHDEIDTPFGEVRTKFGGGLAGHNGLKSLKAQLGTADFHRIRLGVGRPDSTDPEIVAAYVLGRWRQPKSEVQALIDAGADAAEKLILDSDTNALSAP
ncbi:MAG: aminoacyl-tRNA hydrolase [Solirubrobacterales bacterium]|nr:aminoacyl-tRNA hydrolase [Solirubrobacterales bacterium]